MTKKIEIQFKLVDPDEEFDPFPADAQMITRIITRGGEIAIQGLGKLKLVNIHDNKVNLKLQVTDELYDELNNGFERSRNNRR